MTQTRDGSAERALDAGESRSAKADHVLVLQAVFSQRLGWVWRPRLARLEPLHFAPGDLREVRVVAVDARQHRAGECAEWHVGQQRQAHWRRDHQVVFPPDEEQRRGKVFACIPGWKVVGLQGNDTHSCSPCSGAATIAPAAVSPRQAAKFFWSCEPSKSKLSRPMFNS